MSEAPIPSAAYAAGVARGEWQDDPAQRPALAELDRLHVALSKPVDAGGFLSLLVLRVMLGVGESIAFPGTSKIIARHVPPERRGIANASVAAGIALLKRGGFIHQLGERQQLGFQGGVLFIQRLGDTVQLPPLLFNRRVIRAGPPFTF